MNRSSSLLLPLMLLVALEMRGQERVFAGPSVGYEFSVPLLLQRAEGAINYDATFAGTGTSYSHTAIMGAQLYAPRASGDRIGFSSRIAMYATVLNFTSDRFVPGIGLDAATDTLPEDRFREIRVDATAVTLVADVQARVSLGDRLVGGAGLWGGVRVAGQFMRSERPVVIPDGVDEDEVTTYKGGGAFDSHQFGYGATFSLGLQTPLTSRMMLLPEVTSRLDAVGLARGLGFQALTIGAGISLLFDASEAPPVVSAEPAGLGAVVAPRVDSLARVPKLEARVDLFADGALGVSHSVSVVTEDVVNRMFMALPRTLLYDRNAFDIPGGFARLEREGADVFTPRDVAGLDAAGHYRHVLNVLGLRLRASPGATLTVAGVGASDEPPSLGRVRAETVRDYLRDVWRIDPSRVEVREERGATAAVRLDGAASLFSTPFLSQWRTRRLRMPPIGLDRSITAEAGVRRWTLDLAHGDRHIRRYTSDSGTVDPVFDLRFIAGGEQRTEIPPIVATLTVEDSLGRSVVATDRLAVVRAASTQVPVARRERLEFIEFEEPADSVGVKRLSTRLAARALRNGATVSVGLVGRVREHRALEVSRVAEELLGAANERGVRLARFVAEQAGAGDVGMPQGVRIVVDQERPATGDGDEAE